MSSPLLPAIIVGLGAVAFYTMTTGSSSKRANVMKKIKPVSVDDMMSAKTGKEQFDLLSKNVLQIGEQGMIVGLNGKQKKLADLKVPEVPKGYELLEDQDGFVYVKVIGSNHCPIAFSVNKVVNPSDFVIWMVFSQNIDLEKANSCVMNMK